MFDLVCTLLKHLGFDFEIVPSIGANAQNQFENLLPRRHALRKKMDALPSH